MSEQLLIDYRIKCTDLKGAVAAAEEIAREQTVETPLSLVEDEFFQKSIIGQVVEVREFATDSFKVESQLDFALDHGVKGILVSPFLVGLETVNYIAGNYPLIIMVHPAMSGSLFNDPEQGIAPGVMLGTLFRSIGADISIYPLAGGRFPFTPEDCQSINDALLTPDLQVKRSFPALAGGLKIGNVAQIALEYGRDTLLLMGGDLLESASELADNTRKIVTQFDRLFPEVRKIADTDPAFSVCDYHSSQSSKEIVPQLQAYLKFSSDFSWEKKSRFGLQEYQRKQLP